MNNSKTARQEDEELRIQIERCSITDWDLMWCERYCLEFQKHIIPLSKWQQILVGWRLRFEDWYNQTFGKTTNVTLRQYDTVARALITSIVISYARPWSGNRARDGKKDSIEKKIVTCLNEEGAILHEKMKTMRNRIVAHSDGKSWNVQVTAEQPSTVETKSTDPFEYLSYDEVSSILANLTKLRSEVSSFKSNAVAKLSIYNGI